MRTFISLTALALLAGCSVVPRHSWTFDPNRPQAKASLPMEQVVALTDRVAQLQIERNELRARIAGEPDIWARQVLYSRLHGVGMELSRRERGLARVASAR